MANRLHLDFSIPGTHDRKAFVDEYVQRPEFIRAPLSDAELDTIANYILWGKDPDGQSIVQKGDISIETRNKTWQRDDTESLDAMMESPTFNEASLRRPTEARTKIGREVFSREDALAQCPSHMKSIFEELFARIDRLELYIHWYEFDHGKRKEEPRSALQKRFTPEEVNAARKIAATWNQYKYLKQRHLIVELRREQFTLRDSYIERHMRHTPPEPDLDPVNLDFEAEIPVFPLGLVGTPFSDLVFKPETELNPYTYTEDEIDTLIKHYWSKKQQSRPQLFFDFGELEHVYELFGQLNEIEEDLDTLSLESNMKKLLDTLKYYIALTDLNEAQKEILDLKINKVKNQDIADQINKKYGKSYTANYISTIFRQKIIPHINETANFHALIIENMCFEENFKKCNGCGKILLIDAENFVRKSRSKDGFSTKCKKCDRADRQKKKVN